MVRRHPAAFRQAHPPRMVNNIYLDSAGLTDYHDHIDGVANRVKTRVRWYGEFGGRVETPVLERKFKRGALGGKTCAALPPFILNGEGVGPALAKAFAVAELPDSLRVRLPFLRPSLTNRYRRHYFVSGDGRFRLTVDSELRAGPPHTTKPDGATAPTPLIVLELKFSPEHDDGAAAVMNAFPFRVGRCSKYVLGIEQTRGSI